MHKRAQITAFIIIGIIIIAVFGFIFYITKEVSRVKLETEANRIIDAVLATTSLNYYVTLCVEESTKKSLDLVGGQGGPVNLSIYPNPNVYFIGTGINLKRICPTGPCTDVSYNVSYSVMRWNADRDNIKNSKKEPDLNLTPCHLRMNQSYTYMIYNESLNTASNNCTIKPKLCEMPISLLRLPYWDVPPFYCGFKNNISAFKHLPEVEYGRSDFITPLCRPEQCLTDALRIEVPFTTKLKAIPIYAGVDRTNIQEQMENQTARFVHECVKFETVEAFKAFNITKEEVFINLTMADNGIEILATFPLTIKIQDYEPVLRILQFKTMVPVRLKPIYKLARYLAEKENTDLNFSIERDWYKNPYYLTNFTLEIIETGNRTFCSPHCTKTPMNVHVPGGDRIIRINDTNSAHFLRNGPFTYQFAIQNRPPALDYIGLTNNPTPDGYDIVAIENQTITIRPNAADPDDDSVSYEYSGWKETWNETFDEDYKPEPFCRANATKCIVRDPNPVHEWTHSPLFIQTKSAANYTARHSDVGPHEVTVCAKDSDGQRDCQTIRILVDDEFNVMAYANNYYNDTGEFARNITSFEDPLHLYAEVIDYFSPGNVNFKWLADKMPEGGPVSQIYDGGKAQLTLPLEDSSYSNIRGIKDFFTAADNVGRGTTDVGIYMLLADVVKNPGGTTDQGAVNMTFYKCLPHSAPGSPPFPFNTTDPYMADHTCCFGGAEDNNNPPLPGAGVIWGTYKGTDAVCYLATKEYGCYNANFDSSVEHLDILNPSTKYKVISGAVTPVYSTYAQDYALFDNDDLVKNDVFERSFNGTCSGNRGNTCTGTPIEVRKKFLTCGDRNIYAGEIERCSGCSLTSSSSAGCVNATRDSTWETYAGIAGATGQCNQNPVCTDSPDSPNGYSTPDDAIPDDIQWLCNATCDGEGNCDATTQSLCNDCYGEQSCYDSDEGLVGDSEYFTSGFVEGQSGGCEEGECAPEEFGEDYTSDTCSGQYAVNEYYCNSPGTHPPIYDYETIPCSDVQQDITPHMEDTNSDGFMECFGGKISKCVSGACQDDDSMTSTNAGDTLSEGCISSSKQYRKVDYLDINGDTISDSCKYTYINIANMNEVMCNQCRTTNSAWTWTGSSCIYP